MAVRHLPDPSSRTGVDLGLLKDFGHRYGSVMDLTVDDQTLDLTCLDAVIPAEAKDQANWT